MPAELERATQPLPLYFPPVPVKFTHKAVPQPCGTQRWWHASKRQSSTMAFSTRGAGSFTQHSPAAKINREGHKAQFVFSLLFFLPQYSCSCQVPLRAPGQLAGQMPELGVGGSRARPWGQTPGSHRAPIPAAASAAPASAGHGSPRRRPARRRRGLDASPRWRRREQRAPWGRAPPRLAVSPRWRRRRVSPVGRRRPGRGGGGEGFHSGGRRCHTGALPGWRPAVPGQRAGKCRWGGGGRRAPEGGGRRAKVGARRDVRPLCGAPGVGERHGSGGLDPSVAGARRWGGVCVREAAAPHPSMEAGGVGASS